MSTKKLQLIGESLSVNDEQLAAALNNYFTDNPVTPGATTEQAAQIEANKTAIEELKNSGVGAPGEPGEDGNDGKDGVSPTIQITDIEGGHRITVTDVNGSRNFDVMDGKDGVGTPGTPGTNGVSPTITITSIEGGHRVTITDVNGTKSFDVMDGADGKDGTSSTGGGSSVELDTTLKVSGKAADAGAVGEQLSSLSQKIADQATTQSQKDSAQDEAIGKKANDADLAAVAKSGSYNDLSGKPTIPTVPSALKNPNALTFKGAVSATYDGSEAVSVEIPEGGSGSNYTLPIANATTLGGVKPEAKTDTMNQPVGVDANGRLYAPAAALPTDEQVSASVDAYLTENGVKCNDVWVDLGTVTVAEGEEVYSLSWPLDGYIKKFCIRGYVYTHAGSKNADILPHSLVNGGPLIPGNFSWPMGDGTQKYNMFCYAEKKFIGTFNGGCTWEGFGGTTTFAGLPNARYLPHANNNNNISTRLGLAAYWQDILFPAGSEFRAWVVYE